MDLKQEIEALKTRVAQLEAAQANTSTRVSSRAPGPGEPRMWTTTQAADFLGYSSDTVIRMCERGKFEGVVRNGRGAGVRYKIPRTSVLDFYDTIKSKIVKRTLRVA